MKKMLQRVLFGALTLAFALLLIPSEEAKAGSNNSSATAQMIQINTPVSGISYDGDDQHWYKFTAPANGYFTATVTQQQLGVSDYIDFYIYNQNNERIYYSWYSSVDTYVISAANGHTFYLNIEDISSYDDSSFMLQVNFTVDPKWETENNDTAKTADVLKNKITTYGVINNYDNGDYYRFSLSKPSKVDITVGPKVTEIGKNTYYSATLYDSKGRNDYLSYSSTITKQTVYLAKGTYYLKITGGTNVPYQVKYSAKSLTLASTEIKSVASRLPYKGASYRYLGKIKLKKSYNVYDGLELKVSKKSNMKNPVIDEHGTFGAYSYYNPNMIEKNYTSLYRGTYYIRVRGFINDPFGQKIYGPWGKAVKKKL